MQKTKKLIIDTTQNNDYANRTFSNGKTAWELVLESLSQNCHEYDIYVLGYEDKISLPDLASFIRIENTSSALLQALQKIDSQTNTFVYIYGDTPLLDWELCSALLEQHERYVADFSFADGYPEGLCCTIYNKDILARLAQLSAPEAPIERGILQKLVEKDINSFAVELKIAQDDLRILRLALHSSSKRNFMLIEKLLQVPRAGLDRYIAKHLELSKTLPSYYQIQISAHCHQSCSFCPYPKMVGDPQEQEAEMGLPLWTKILQSIAEFSDDAYIGLAPFGEPASNSSIYNMIEQALSYPKFRVVIETSGLGWNYQDLLELLPEERLTWIVGIDSIDPVLYNRLRGTGFEEALAFVDFLAEHDKEQVYIQALRMQDNDGELVDFYKHWKAKNIKTIIQKYNDFAKFIPDRKLVSLEPPKRMPCRRLASEMIIDINGNILQCIQDTQQSTKKIETKDFELKGTWLQQNKLYARHINGDLPEICKKCDEYYIFNF